MLRWRLRWVGHHVIVTCLVVHALSFIFISTSASNPLGLALPLANTENW